MKYYVLASGSKGNCSLIVSNETIIMLDCGCSKKYINDSLKELNYTFDDIDALPNENAIYSAFLEKQQKIFNYINEQLYEKFTPYNRLSTEHQIYQSYIISMLKEYDVLVSDKIDKNDVQLISGYMG